MSVSGCSIRKASWEEDRELLLSIRKPVFVEEQNVPEEIEVDEFDPVSEHVLAFDEDEKPIGTARLLPDGRIGRVAVLSEWRKRGVGADLMNELINTAREMGRKELSLHAQTWTIGFYESLDFEVEGEEFDEAGIPHRTMRRRL